MKNLLKISFIATIICSNFSFAADISDGKVLATYKQDNKTVEVKQSDVAEQFKGLFEMNPELKGKKITDLPANVQDRLVRSYVSTKLLEIEAQKKGIENSADFQEKVVMFKKQLAQQENLNDILKKAVTPELIEKEYVKFEDSIKNAEEVKVRHILVEAEVDVISIKSRLEKGEKFNDLAKQLSADKSSKAKGGELGYIKQGDTVPEFETVAFALKKGEVSKPVKTPFGWHVIKLEDRRKIKLPSKEEGLSIAKAKLENETIEKHLEDLNKTFDVKISIDSAPKSQEKAVEAPKPAVEAKK
jgi:peptidyl-prolyl cis-trans isomerase C